jgi:hypothetical protein
LETIFIGGLPLVPYRGFSRFLAFKPVAVHKVQEVCRLAQQKRQVHHFQVKTTILHDAITSTQGPFGASDEPLGCGVAICGPTRRTGYQPFRNAFAICLWQRRFFWQWPVVARHCHSF